MKNTINIDFGKCHGLCTLRSRDRVPFFANVQCHIIKNLLTSTVRAVWENIKPRSCCIDLAIARSIQQDLGLIFSRTALTLSQ